MTSEPSTPQPGHRFLPHYDKNGIDCAMCAHADLDDGERLICRKYHNRRVPFARDEQPDACGPYGQFFERSDR